MGDNNEKFDSLSELYKRILPALNTKVIELQREGSIFVEPLDIWNYCLKTKWKNRGDLRIYQIVDDILSVDNILLENYVIENIKNNKRNIGENE